MVEEKNRNIKNYEEEIKNLKIENKRLEKDLSDFAEISDSELKKVRGEKWKN